MNAPLWLRTEAVIAKRLLLIGAAVCGAVWLILQVKVVAVGAFLGFVQAALLWPVNRYLRRFMPRALAALVTISAYMAFFLGMMWFLAGELLASWTELYEAAVGGIRTANQWALDNGYEIPAGYLTTLESQLQERIAPIAMGVSNAAMVAVNTTGLGVMILTLGTFLTIFALIGGDKLWYGIRETLSASVRGPADSAMFAAVRTARGWMWAATITGIVDGVFIGLGMYLLKVPLALPVAVLTFVLGFIPFVGAAIAGAIAVIVALFFGGPMTAVWTLIIVLVVQQVEGNVLVPILLSKAMQFNPIVTMLVAAAGGTAFGMAGLFLAVPVTGIVAAAVKAWRTYPEPLSASPQLPPEPDPPSDDPLEGDVAA